MESEIALPMQERQMHTTFPMMGENRIRVMFRIYGL